MKRKVDCLLLIFGAISLIATLCLLPSARASEATVNPNMLPMFGQPKIERTEDLRNADESFVRDNTLRYRSRQAASTAIAAQGWGAVKTKQFETAMLRFNQAWLLNPANYRAFWGFGAVLSQQGRLAEAVEQLETARELIDEPAQRSALLSDLATVQSEYAASLPPERQLERAQRFILANNRFTESLENDPAFAPAWREWAISLYEQERFREAWLRVKRARELNADPFPPDFLKKLAAKMPEPN